MAWTKQGLFLFCHGQTQLLQPGGAGQGELVLLRGFLVTPTTTSPFVQVCSFLSEPNWEKKVSRVECHFQPVFVSAYASHGCICLDGVAFTFLITLFLQRHPLQFCLGLNKLPPLGLVLQNGIQITYLFSASSCCNFTSLFGFCMGS